MCAKCFNVGGGLVRNGSPTEDKMLLPPHYPFQRVRGGSWRWLHAEAVEPKQSQFRRAGKLVVCTGDEAGKQRLVRNMDRDLARRIQRDHYLQRRQESFPQVMQTY